LNDLALLIMQVKKTKPAVTLVAVAHRGAGGHGLARWERNLHRDQLFGRQFCPRRSPRCRLGRDRSSEPIAESPRRHGTLSRARASRMESADCAAARGGSRSRWDQTWQSPSGLCAPITVRPLALQMAVNRSGFQIQPGALLWDLCSVEKPARDGTTAHR